MESGIPQIARMVSHSATTVLGRQPAGAFSRFRRSVNRSRRASRPAQNSRFHRAQRSLQDLGDLVVTQTFHFAQHQRRAIVRIDLRQRRFDQRFPLVIHRQFHRRARRIRQPIQIAMGFARRRLQRNFLAAMPSEPAPVIARFVYRDAVNPSLQRTLPAEGMHVAEYFQEYFLHHIRRIARIVGQPADQIEDRVLEARQQGFVSGFLAVASAGRLSPALPAR